MRFLIYNEDQELMRVVGRQEEAMAICSIRKGWSYKTIRNSVKRIDLNQFEEALI